MRMIYATMFNPRMFSQSLTEAGVPDRLLSFYEMKKTPEKWASKFDHWVYTGLHPNEEPRVIRDVARRTRLNMIKRLRDYETGKIEKT